MPIKDFLLLLGLIEVGRTAPNVGIAYHTKKFPGWEGKKIISFAFN